MDLGDVPAWLSLVVTSVLSYMLYRLTAQIHAVEVGRDRRAEEIDERAQAVRVNAWPNDKGGHAWEIIVRNDSDMPVFEVQVAALQLSQTVQQQGVVRYGPVATSNSLDMQQHELRPSEEVRLGWDGEVPPPEVVRVMTLSFRDVHHVRWFRDSAGRLRKQR